MISSDSIYITNFDSCILLENKKSKIQRFYLINFTWERFTILEMNNGQFCRIRTDFADFRSRFDSSTEQMLNKFSCPLFAILTIVTVTDCKLGGHTLAKTTKERDLGIIITGHLKSTISIHLDVVTKISAIRTLKKKRIENLCLMRLSKNSLLKKLAVPVKRLRGESSLSQHLYHYYHYHNINFNIENK
ncbi:hypothetical protein BpHYR1_034843 [Brachionus plicatilis]|uniref:Uncharacterized protein n=1 Tax=Brachionus plicatilis TaxID=10195 RepID=A0A3M7T9Y5_BRAPC|nr:hypothetical protein BpHYR1_034843 [Brachionus plicatilis]